MNKVPFIGSRVPQDFQTEEMLVQTNTQKSIIKSFYKVLEKPAEHFFQFKQHSSGDYYDK